MDQEEKNKKNNKRITKKMDQLPIKNQINFQREGLNTINLREIIE
tara:strand:- start:244 stop:378 length:135 start_codon:yes stop_codon:yes gene_type:complete